jgi:hypothetical protein
VSRRTGLILAVALIVLTIGVIGTLLLRPTSTTTTSAGVTVECIGGDEAECAAWAASVLADGPGVHTFDPEDLERVRVGRSILGLVGDCQAEYFLGRFDDVAARERVPCPGD